MEKTELKQRLEEVKTKLKSICKDAHYADSLISDILSLKGQIDHEPTIVHVAESDIVDKVKGDLFEVGLTKDGKAIYHVYGGYTIVADPRLSGLHGTISNFVKAETLSENLSDDLKKMIRDDMDVSAWVLAAPMYAFSDIDLKYKIATDIVEWMNSFTSSILESDLQDEDPIKNIEFEKSFEDIEDIDGLMKQLDPSIQ